jgi:hypothetical protein
MYFIVDTHGAITRIPIVEVDLCGGCGQGTEVHPHVLEFNAGNYPRVAEVDKCPCFTAGVR